MEYNKLVRDKIPGIVLEDKKIPITHVADEKEYWEKLKDKLLEETREYLKDPTDDELADILEVIDAIIAFKKISSEELNDLKKLKAEERGKFNERIILERVLDQ